MPCKHINDEWEDCEKDHGHCFKTTCSLCGEITYRDCEQNRG